MTAFEGWVISLIMGFTAGAIAIIQLKIKPIKTAEEVGLELIRGLRDGSIVLSSDEQAKDLSVDSGKAPVS